MTIFSLYFVIDENWVCKVIYPSEKKIILDLDERIV